MSLNALTDRRRSRRRAGCGFTLVELLVVISLITLLASAAMPTIVTLFNSGAADQAYNLLAAQVSAARALAIENSTYAGVHVQMDANEPNTCWSCIVTYDNTSGLFRVPENVFPHRMPGKMAFGEISGNFIAGDTYGTLNDNQLADFTSFTIVFSPSGKLVRQVNGQAIMFDHNDKVFKGSDTKIWDPDLADGESGVGAVTMFSYTELKTLPVSDGGDSSVITRDDFLNESGQFLAVNVYSGQLFRWR